MLRYRYGASECLHLSENLALGEGVADLMTAAHTHGVDAEEPGVEIARDDAEALIGVLANLAGGLQAGGLDEHLTNRMHRRLARDLRDAEDASLGDLLQVLNMRLRRALGEMP